jgi:hypothetical protein
MVITTQILVLFPGLFPESKTITSTALPNTLKETFYTERDIYTSLSITQEHQVAVVQMKQTRTLVVTSGKEMYKGRFIQW